MAIRNHISVDDLEKELIFSTSRSSGPGGQNINKVNTKVTLRFDVNNSSFLNQEEKEIIAKKLSSKLTKDGMLILSSQEKRSQIQNKATVLNKLENLLNRALVRKKKRKPTKPSKSAVEKRLKEKKIQSEKKKWRKGD